MLYDALLELITDLNKHKMKNQEIWQEARKLKLGSKFLENLDTLLTSLENQDKQCVIQRVVFSETELPNINSTEFISYLQKNGYGRLSEIHLLKNNDVYCVKKVYRHYLNTLEFGN